MGQNVINLQALSLSLSLSLKSNLTLRGQNELEAEDRSNYTELLPKLLSSFMLKLSQFSDGLPRKSDLSF